MSDRISFAAKITSEGRRLKGSVVLAGSRTLRNGELVEVDPLALMKADATDVFATIDHDPTRTVGRTRNHTLEVRRTPTGIEFETGELPNTTYANDALALAEGDYYGGSSFTVDGYRSNFSTDPETGMRVRTINSIKRLVDVAIVMDPAFTNSTAAAFSKESEVPDEIIEAPETEAPPTKRASAKFTKGGETAGSPIVQVAEPTLYDRTLGFAKTLNNDQLKAAVAGAWSEGGDQPDALAMQRIEAFTKEAEDRRVAAATSDMHRRELKFRRDITLGIAPQAPEEAEVFASDDYKAAFTKYLRNGDKAVMEQFAQSIAGDGTQGGYMVPDGFLNRIVETQKAYGGVARVADSITTSDGIPLRWAANDDTANVASIAAEGSAGSTGADKVFGQVTLGAFSYDATGASNLPLKVSKELLQDAAFDVEAFIGRNLGTRIGRKQAADFATGDGSGKPVGLLSKTPDTMSATTLLAALIEHHFQVDAAYRDAGNCKWVLSDTTLAKAYGSVDGNGRPLFIPEAQSGGSDRPAGVLLGYPVIIDNGAGNLVAFGDIRQGFIIRYVRGVQVDVDPYTYISTRQIGFHAWARADSNIQDAAAYSVSDYTSVNADA